MFPENWKKTKEYCRHWQMSRSAEAPFLLLNKAHIFISKCFRRMFAVSFENS